MKHLIFSLIFLGALSVQAENYHLKVHYSEFYDFTVWINKEPVFLSSNNPGNGELKIDVTKNVYQGSNQVKVCYIPLDKGEGVKPNLSKLARVILQKESQLNKPGYRKPAQDRFLSYNLAPHSANFVPGVEACNANRFKAFDANLAAAPRDLDLPGESRALEISDQFIEEIKPEQSQDPSMPPSMDMPGVAENPSAPNPPRVPSSANMAPPTTNLNVKPDGQPAVIGDVGPSEFPQAPPAPKVESQFPDQIPLPPPPPQ